jgi:sugar lactone lactonase YvrE
MMMKSVLSLLFTGCALSGAITTQAQSNYEPYSFTTLAGLGPGSADGTGSAARFNTPAGVAVDSAGNVYVADEVNSTVRKITSAGVVSTLAGLPGNRGSADGTGSAARLDNPFGVAVDSAGNVYVADSGNSTIRKITPAGVVSTLAGSAGVSGSADGTGSAAQFNGPEGVAVDSAGSVYVADSGNSTIRKITPAGVVSTLAGSAGVFGSADGTGSAAQFSFPDGVAVDSAGNVYVADTSNSTIREITPAGVVSTLAGSAGVFGSADGTGIAARFTLPHGVAVDSAGSVYVADTNNNTIRKITPAGVVSTLAGSGTQGSADGTGSAAQFSLPEGVAVDSAGNLYVADTSNDTIRKITSAGGVSTLAGLGGFGSADGTGSVARFKDPQGVAVDSGGNVYVADSSNHTIRKITPAGIVSTLAGSAGVSGSAEGTGSAARFNDPFGVAVDSAGNVYVADTSNYTIRKITPAGVVSTLAGSAGSPGSADGTGSAARFDLPEGVAVDSAGNVYVADSNNSTIRKITSAGVVSTLAGSAGIQGSADGTGSAAQFDTPEGVAVDSAGNVYVADSLNETIRKITPAGVVSTLAGLAGTGGSADGTGSAARFEKPVGVAADSAGNVFVADFIATIRKITSGGVVTTLAGLAGSFGSADGTGSAARFFSPSGVAVDSAGNVYVVDSGNNTISVGVLAQPVITSPLSATCIVGQEFTYQFGASNATSLAASSLPPGLTFDATLSAIVGTPTTAGTFQVSLSATNAGGTTTATLTITVQPAPSSGPVITSSTSATGRVGQRFDFQVITVGGSATARVSADGLPPGLSIDAVTGLISGTPTAEGSSAVTFTVTDGNLTTTSVLQLTFSADPALPVIVSSSSASLTPGQSFSYTIDAPATSAPGDITIFTLIGTLPMGLGFDPNTGTISGTFTGLLRDNKSPNRPDLSGGIVTNVQLFATNSHGTSTLPLIFFLAPTGAVNISTRLAVGTGDNVLIAGFIITGNAPKRVIIRAIGPSLPLPGVLQDTTLELHDANGILGSNDNWRDSQENEIIATTIAPSDDRESAIVATISPGNYTAVVRGKNDVTGIAVVELYDLGTASLDTSSDAKLAQISTRGTVLGGDDVLIGGFIISGPASKVIVRAIGPSLNGLVPGALQDTVLELHDGFGSLVSMNDDWQSTQAQQIKDTGVPPTDDRESAIVATLAPGNYTGIVRGKNDSTGVALVEVYGLK